VQRIAALEEEMSGAASRMEFEKCAQLRDEIKRLQAKGGETPTHSTGGTGGPGIPAEQATGPQRRTRNMNVSNLRRMQESSAVAKSRRLPKEAHTLPSQQGGEMDPYTYERQRAKERADLKGAMGIQGGNHASCPWLHDWQQPGGGAGGEKVGNHRPGTEAAKIEDRSNQLKELADKLDTTKSQERTQLIMYAGLAAACILSGRLTVDAIIMRVVLIAIAAFLYTKLRPGAFDDLTMPKLW